jgi:hypothetical protein
MLWEAGAAGALDFHEDWLDSKGALDVTDPAEKSRQARFVEAGPPPSWLTDPDEPIPQPVVEMHAELKDGRAMAIEIAEPHIAAALALPQILDTPWVLDVNKVAVLGYGGLNRYMCADFNTGPGTSLPQKRTTYDEVQRILDRGLDFWWNYEDGADDFNEGYAAWFAKGQHAADFGANVLKLPDGMGCYASCDMDVGLQPSQAHFESQRGFRDGYGLGPAGVYGSTVVINALADAGTSQFGWITLAKSWNHGVLTDPGKGHLDQVGQVFSGSADTNNQLQPISGSYRHAIGDVVTPEQMQTLIDEMHKQTAFILRGDVDANHQALPPGQNGHPDNLTFLRRYGPLAGWRPYRIKNDEDPTGAVILFAPGAHPQYVTAEQWAILNSLGLVAPLGPDINKLQMAKLIEFYESAASALKRPPAPSPVAS